MRIAYIPALFFVACISPVCFPDGAAPPVLSMATAARASECVKCGKCEQASPQHITIREELQNAREAFGME